MTVKRLIKKLQEFEPELKVVIDGYEAGVEDVEFIKSVEIAKNVHKERYFGPHELFENLEEEESLEGYEISQAVYISRKDKV